MPDRTGVVVAAGSGERFSHHRPKAFVPLGGVPLLLHSCITLSALCSRLIVVAAPDHVGTARDLLAAARLHPGARAVVCAGGATRTASVAAGVAACGALDPDHLVAVHDAARPLISAALAERVFAAVADGWDAAAPGLPVVDTLKLVGDDERVLRTADRAGLWTVQTPQVFRWAALRRAYAGEPSPATDDLALVEHAGGRVRLVQGEPRNLKITYREDLAIAEALLEVT